MQTVREIISLSAKYLKENGVESARLDSELLLAKVLGLTRLQLYLEIDRPLEEEELAALRKPLWERAKKRVPVAYLLGKKEFYGLDLCVNPHVLIPRPETELLVELVLAHAPSQARGLEIGTGSGAISIALARTRGDLKILATDISPEALAVAQENVERHGLDGQIQLLAGDLFAPLIGLGPFDFLVSNPPYLAPEEFPQLAPELAHEPQGALLGGERGLEIIASLVQDGFSQLSPGGFFALEIGPGQGEAIEKLARARGFEQCETHFDYAGGERFFSAWRPEM